MELTLDSEETAALAAALRTYISDLRMEVVDTERKRLRDELKRREVLLTSIAGRLHSGAPAPASWPYEPPPDADSEA